MPDLTIPVNLRDFGTGSDDPRRPGAPPPILESNEQRRYGIQFRQALTPDEFRAFQADFGLALNAYVTELTYIELVDRETVDRLRLHPLVNGVFPYWAKYKIAPDIGRIKDQTPRRRDMPGLLLWAVLFPESDPDEVADALEHLGATGVHVVNDRDLGGVARLGFTIAAQDQIQAVAALETVSWIEEAPETLPDSGMPNEILESGKLNGAPFADVGLRGKHQRIGVLERGFLDIEHCWFRGSPPNTPGSTHRKIAASHDDSHLATFKHSAFVVGLLCGDDPADLDPDAARGIACDARVVYGNRDDYDGGSTPPTLLDYLTKAAKAKAHIHNNSWHSTDSVEYSQTAVDVDTFAWEHEECLVVGSSGRMGQTQRGAPGVAKNTLCVSAAYVGDEGSCFANGIVGPSQDQRRKPDLVALGCGLVSAIAESGCDTDLDQTISSDPLVTPCCAPAEVFCATSFSTPIVSAAAAIARQYFVEGWYPTGQRTPGDRLIPSGALLKAILLNAAAKTTCGGGYPNDDEGWGLLQLDRALYLGTGARKPRVWDIRHADGLTGGDEQSFAVDIAGAGADSVPLKVTLVWTDPPLEASSYSDPVVNNLDLEVTAPDGSSIYRGNVFSAGESVVGGSADTRNNVEMVLVNTPMQGLWTIAVKGTRVLHVGDIRPQGFALVVTGDLV